MDVLAIIDHSISLVSRLREISKNLTEAEFKNILADLLNELADAKMHIAGLKDKLSEQADEIRAFKAVSLAAKQKPTIKFGCYQFDGEEGLYCTACYDTKGQKSLTTHLGGPIRMCPVCKATLKA